MERALMELLSRHTTLAVAATDAEGRLTLMMPALEKMLGHAYRPTPEEDIPSEFRLYALDGHTRLRPEDMPIARARNGETVIDAVITARPDPSTDRLIFFRVNAAPLREPNGDIRGALALIQEITDDWVAQQRESEFRQRLITTLNHELRTPVAKLSNNLELLAEVRDDLPDWARSALDALTRTTEDLRTLSGTVAQLIELEAAAAVVPTHQDVAEIVRSLEADLRDVLDEHGVGLRVDVPERLPATVDRAATQRALREVVRNGVRLAPPGSVIPVTARIEEQCLVVRIGDDWSRLSDEDRRKLFDPFAHGDTGPAFNSVGLGLAYARVIAHAMGGDLTLEPTPAGGTDAIWRVNRYGERGQMLILRLRAR